MKKKIIVNYHKTLKILLVLSLLCVNLNITNVKASDCSSYISDETLLEIYNAAFAEQSYDYYTKYRNTNTNMDQLRVNITFYTYSGYFKKVEWITRNGVISLSITPTNKLYASTYNNANVLSAHAAEAWRLLYARHSSDTRWRNTASMEAQFHCHVIYAGGAKTPWNIEPSRTESNWAVVIANGCNP